MNDSYQKNKLILFGVLFGICVQSYSQTANSSVYGGSGGAATVLGGSINPLELLIQKGQSKKSSQSSVDEYSYKLKIVLDDMKSWSQNIGWEEHSEETQNLISTYWDWHINQLTRGVEPDDMELIKYVHKYREQINISIINDRIDNELEIEKFSNNLLIDGLSLAYSISEGDFNKIENYIKSNGFDYVFDESDNEIKFYNKHIGDISIHFIIAKSNGDYSIGFSYSDLNGGLFMEKIENRIKKYPFMKYIEEDRSYIFYVPKTKHADHNKSFDYASSIMIDGQNIRFFTPVVNNSYYLWDKVISDLLNQ